MTHPDAIDRIIRTVRTDYQAINSLGRVLYTFGDEKSAKAWAKDNVHLHDGLRVEEVKVMARAIYTPRSSRRNDFRLPRWAAVPNQIGAVQ